MNQSRGYTLIEVMIALMVFSILASITTSVMHRILSQYRILQDHYHQWQTIDTLVADFQLQTQGYINKSITSNENRVFPSFIGQHDYTEWTYTSTPDAKLNRVAYLCEGGKLIQRHWQQIDAIARKNYQQKILLDHLSECRFRYMNTKSQTNGHWERDQGNNPIGLQIVLAWNAQQKLQLWFSLPPFYYELETNA